MTINEKIQAVLDYLDWRDESGAISGMSAGLEDYRNFLVLDDLMSRQRRALDRLETETGELADELRGTLGGSSA